MNLILTIGLIGVVGYGYYQKNTMGISVPCLQVPTLGLAYRP